MSAKAPRHHDGMMWSQCSIEGGMWRQWLTAFGLGACADPHAPHPPASLAPRKTQYLLPYRVPARMTKAAVAGLGSIFHLSHSNQHTSAPHLPPPSPASGLQSRRSDLGAEDGVAYLVIPSTRTTPNHRPPRNLWRFPTHASREDSECDDMLWPSTTPVAVKLALIIAVIFCRFFRPPHPPTRLENLLHTTVFLAAFWTFWGSLFEYLFLYSLNLTRVVQRIDLVPQYGNMFLVVAASCWYDVPLSCSAGGLEIPAMRSPVSAFLG